MIISASDHVTSLLSIDRFFISRMLTFLTPSFFVFVDDVDTDLLRLLAAKAMNNKSSKKGDSLKRLSGGKHGLNGAEFV